MQNQDIYNNVTRTVTHALVSGRTSVSASSAVDLQGYEGIGELMLNAELASAGSSPTLDVTLQDCDTSDGQFAEVASAKGGPIAFTQVTDAAGAGLQVKALDFKSLKRFVKVVPVLGGTGGPAITFSTAIRGRKKVFGTPSAQAL